MVAGAGECSSCVIYRAKHEYKCENCKLSTNYNNDVGALEYKFNEHHAIAISPILFSKHISAKCHFANLALREIIDGTLYIENPEELRYDLLTKRDTYGYANQNINNCLHSYGDKPLIVFRYLDAKWILRWKILAMEEFEGILPIFAGKNYLSDDCLYLIDEVNDSRNRRYDSDRINFSLIYSAAKILLRYEYLIKPAILSAELNNKDENRPN